jgi:hypothetical protein
LRPIVSATGRPQADGRRTKQDVLFKSFLGTKTTILRIGLIFTIFSMNKIKTEFLFYSKKPPKKSLCFAEPGPAAIATKVFGF